MHIRKCKRKLNVLVLLPSAGMNSFHGSGFGGKVLLSFVFSDFGMSSDCLFLAKHRYAQPLEAF